MSTPPLPKSPTSLNVIALISGGKDSLYSILHCIRNGHKVVALGNLHPPSRRTNNVKNEEEFEEEDLDSFMYQTIGHSIIPQYESALGIPLYRQEIIGSAVDTGRVYRDQQQQRNQPSSGKGDYGEGEVREEDADETESLIPLLQRIKAAHPEANAISAGAILSTYQRTRIENVAARMGLVPLAWLWMYPSLPAPLERMGLPGDAGLLEDMAACGCEARIIKVASGGLDGGFLWGDVSGRDGLVRRRIVNGMRRCVDKDGDGDGVTPESVRRPVVLDEAFAGVLEGVLGDGEKGVMVTGGKEMVKGEWGQLEMLQSTNGGTWVVANITAPEAGPGAEEQMKAIAEKIEAILASTGNGNAPRTTADIVFTTVLLHSMADFALMNGIYVSLFKKPNPPARATVACGDSLPEGVKVMVSAVVDLGARDQRQGLHVQSRSYWAPANIGPYSQAMSVPVQGSEHMVYIAGQIPLEPASMEVMGTSPEALTRPWIENYSTRAVLSLQHLWRIGHAMQVDWWLGAVAFLTGGEHIATQARLAWELWAKMHAREEEEDEDDGDSGLDVWDIKYGGRAHEQVTGATTPRLPNFEVVQSDALVPAFFAVQVEELPRGCDIEWQGLGYRCGELKMAAEETDYGRKIAVSTEQNLSYVSIEIDAEQSPSDVESHLQPVLQALPEGSDGSHTIIYTSQPLSRVPFPAQVVPCKSVWGPRGRQLAAGVIVQRQTSSF
ncbi:adenine nucleotide alpha hydrolases-like protein [Aspergillus sclerotioniger CBS 115572]|uniref:Diphthine--ammonia ligase n=1 Tax=Aspergillus sclerotioniger CBS 115572 TaxID=1450535 RepID=A0A317X7C8_9EURO|nr:adenine nucleotide alpha hydrolases-like protein [Aspergillus sclerotioniger CBS 115572]PWY93457.1 adenine nucleotide alpha hydrolases-like protein [Aspergillus sclerotioniger CBS 115572]